MFTLDDRSDAANADKAASQVVKDQALLDDARRTLARNTDLKSKGFVSQSAVDSAQSNVDALAATPVTRTVNPADQAETLVR